MASSSRRKRIKRLWHDLDDDMEKGPSQIRGPSSQFNGKSSKLVAFGGWTAVDGVAEVDVCLLALAASVANSNSRMALSMIVLDDGKRLFHCHGFFIPSCFDTVSICRYDDALVVFL